MYNTSSVKFDGKRYHQTSVLLEYYLKCCSLFFFYNTSAVMFDGKHYHQTEVWLEVLQSFLPHVHCKLWCQTLSSDWSMTWSVAVLIYDTSAVMFDGKNYQSSVWLDVLQSWYTTHRLLCLMANTIIRLVYDMKCCSLGFKPPSIFILTVSRRYFCCGFLLLLVLAVCIYTLVQLLC